MSDSNFIKQTWTMIAAALSVLLPVIYFWWSLNEKIETTIQESTDLITQQIVRGDTMLAGLHITDLQVRKRVLKREIAAYGNNRVPERLHMLLDAVDEQIKETKEKKW